MLRQPLYVGLGPLTYWNKNAGLNNAQSDAINLLNNPWTTWCKTCQNCGVALIKGFFYATLLKRFSLWWYSSNFLIVVFFKKKFYQWNSLNFILIIVQYYTSVFDFKPVSKYSPYIWTACSCNTRITPKPTDAKQQRTILLQVESKFSHEIFIHRLCNFRIYDTSYKECC